MGALLDFKRPEPAPDPMMRGTALCIACKHEWQATAPVGTSQLECPSCTAHRGVFKHPCEPSGGTRFVCDCSSDLFFILRDGMQCRECGVMAEGF